RRGHALGDRPPYPYRPDRGEKLARCARLATLPPTPATALRRHSRASPATPVARRKPCRTPPPIRTVSIDGRSGQRGQLRGRRAHHDPAPVVAGLVPARGLGVRAVLAATEKVTRGDHRWGAATSAATTSAVLAGNHFDEQVRSRAMVMKRAALTTLVFAAIGLAVAGNIAWVHHNLAAQPGFVSWCNINGEFSCDVVLSS